MADVVVFGCWENGYGVIRQFASIGLDVVGIYSSDEEVWHNSRYLSKKFRCEDPAKNPNRLLGILADNREHLSGALLIPTNDHYSEILSKNKKQLSKHFVVLAEDYDVLSRTLDKSKTYSVAESLGIGTPGIYYPNSMDFLEKNRGCFSFPCLLKPVEGHKFFEKYGFKLFVIGSFSELCEKFADATARGLKMSVHEIVKGPDTNIRDCIIYSDENGKVLFSYVRKKLRQNPPFFGVARVAVTEENAEIASLAARMIGAIGYRGLASVEFKFDDLDKKWKLIEINSRFPLAHMVHVKAGVNIAELVYLHKVKRLRVTPSVQRSGVYWINFYQDIRNTFFLMSREKISLMDFARPYLHEHVFADLDLNDPLPYAIKIQKLIRRTTGKIFRRIGV